MVSNAWLGSSIKHAADPIFSIYGNCLNTTLDTTLDQLGHKIYSMWFITSEPMPRASWARHVLWMFSALSIWWTGGSLFDPWQRLDLISSEHVGRALKEPSPSQFIKACSGHYWETHESVGIAQSADTGASFFRPSSVALFGEVKEKGFKHILIRNDGVVFKWTSKTNICLVLFILNLIWMRITEKHKQKTLKGRCFGEEIQPQNFSISKVLMR